MALFSRDLHPFLVLVVLLFFCLSGLLLGSAVALVLVTALYDLSALELASVIGSPELHPEARNAIVLYQGVVSVFAFVLAPLLLLALSHERMGPYLSPNRYVPLAGLLLAGALIIAFMPLNSVVINWNNHLDLPDAFGFEAWARAKETQMKALTDFLVKFGSTTELLVGILVIALIPAVGEELVFRGVLQRQLGRWIGNPHAAIWVAAFIFSLIHVQFLGLLPRMLLGALLGYMYYWSGNIWVPIFGHFVNNAFTVVMMHLRQIKMVDFEIESSQPMPFTFVAFSILLTAALIAVMRRMFNRPAVSG